MKIPWDETFMNMAIEVARRSHCLHFKVGAVIARMEPGKETILSIGYNGPPRKISPHCNEPAEGGMCKRRNKNGERIKNGFCIGAHAEINAIVNAARNGISIEDATLFITYSPCLECAKHIINSGLRHVIYLQLYSDGLPKNTSEDEKRQKCKEAQRALEIIGKSIACSQYGNDIE